MNIGIPAIQQNTGGGFSGGAGNYVDIIDTLYNIFNLRIIQLNIPDAWNDGADDSQARRGLANIPNRYTQNTIWNAQYAVSTISGSSVIDCFSIVNQFSAQINQINLARVVFALFRATGKDVCMTVNDTNKEITDATETANATNVITGTQGDRAFIATNTNKFIVLGGNGDIIKTIPCDSAGKIQSGTINSFTIAQINSNPITRVDIVAAIGQYVWAIAFSSRTGYQVEDHGKLYSMDSSGVLTLVQSVELQSFNSSSHAASVYKSASCVINNTCYVFLSSTAALSGEAKQTYGSINLSNTGAFAWTQIYQDSSAGNIPAQGSLGFDGTYALYEYGGALYRLNASGSAVVSGVVTLGNNSFYRFRNTEAAFYTDSSNFRSSHSNYGLRYKGKNWMSYNSSLLSYMTLVYEMTGSNNTDDVTALKVILSNGGCGTDDGLTANINSTEYGNSIVGNFGALLIDTTENIIAASSLKVNLNITNSHTLGFKIGFGITGGTYANPTGSNNITGNSTIGSDVGTAGSFMDIALQ